MNLPIYFFGYGSLIHESSLKKTCPNAQIIEQHTLYNFKRVCNAEVFTYIAMNLQRVVSNEFCVNGLILKITNEDEYKKLLEREHIYEIIQIDHPNLEVYTFIAEENLVSSFNHDLQRQKYYIQMCIEGAKKQGDDFYHQFLETTDLELLPMEKIYEDF